MIVKKGLRQVKGGKGGFPVSFWESYSALANTYGGVIINCLVNAEDKQKPALSRAEMARRLNLSDKQLRSASELLKSRGIIQREGPDKGGHWIIN